jgi:hypothetical protein
MVNINIEIPDDLHKDLKITSVMNNITLKNHVINVLEKKIKKEKIKI